MFLWASNLVFHKCGLRVIVDWGWITVLWDVKPCTLVDRLNYASDHKPSELRTAQSSNTMLGKISSPTWTMCLRKLINVLIEPHSGRQLYSLQKKSVSKNMKLSRQARSTHSSRGTGFPWNSIMFPTNTFEMRKRILTPFLIKPRQNA